MGEPICRLCGIPCMNILEQGEDSDMLCCGDRDVEPEDMCDVCEDEEW